MIITAQAYISKIVTMADRVLRLQVDIGKELPSEEEAIIFKLRNQTGYFAFKSERFEDKEVDLIPDYQPEFKNDKTPSQRLRSVLYILWKEEGASNAFEEFYKIQMEKIIDHYKGKLP